MSGIDSFLERKQSTNYFITPKTTAEEAQTPQKSTVAEAQKSNIRDEFVKVKQNNGLLRKFYNFLKNKTGIGLGSNAVEKEIDKFEKGEITQEEVENKISKYQTSQENMVQSAGDITAAASTVGGYFFANNFIKRMKSYNELQAFPTLYKFLNEQTSKTVKNKLSKITNSKTKTTLFLMPLLAMVGGLTKLEFCKIERSGSKEFKIDNTLDKKERKADKWVKKGAKKEENRRNFYTGAINGMLAPVTALAGGIVGIPAYLASITGLRYITSQKENKSVKDFAQSLKDNAVVNTITAAAIAVPTFKKVRFNNALSTNLEKVVNKLKGKHLQLPDLPSKKSTYQELEDLMVNSPSIQKILKPGKLSEKEMNDIITKLTDENIFAVKFLQIKNNGVTQEISEALRESCPPTRTIEQAQQHINKLWGSAEYKVSKLLGVGTVAETYLAKDKSGKEVCVKILKEGINAEKIAKDKEKFIKLITGDTPVDKLTENQKYLIKNVEDLADGISKEVDFANEMNAAKELKKHCKTADVAVPIGTKQGIYVMEKAQGISVKTLADYYKCENQLKNARKYVQKYPKDPQYAKQVKDLEEQMKKIKSRAPEFEDFNLQPEQIKKLLKTYFDVITEQFIKINKNGKVVHADIHPGNIFVNLDSLKSGKGKLFTLIDTGNTITLSKEQAKQALRITTFIKNGNAKDLSQIVLEGAGLPKNLTKEQAVQKVEADLRKYFFDSETKIDSMDMDTFYQLSDNILRKYNIIPNNTQLNLKKAKTSADNSLANLMETLINKRFENGFGIGAISGAIKDSMQMVASNKKTKKFQEFKNLFQMSPKEAWNFLRNKNMLKINSEDYITFKMKQNMPDPKDKFLEALKNMRNV